MSKHRMILLVWALAACAVCTLKAQSNGEVDNTSEIFQDTILGFQFKYYEDNSPYLQYGGGSVTDDIESWSVEIDTGLGIEFRYPPELKLRTRPPEGSDNKLCNSKSLTLDADTSEDNHYPTEIISLYLSSASFVEIANGESFLQDERDSSRWLARGESPMYEASVLDGYQWTGLRGSGDTRSYKDESYAGLGSFQQVFLLNKRSSSCSLVAKCYEGPSDNGDPAYNISEALFFKIVSTLKFIK